MDNAERVLSGVRRAIRNEIAGQSFYSDAAVQCFDPWAKEILATLAREEDGHARLLLAHYEALLDQGRWLDPETARERSASVDITRFTFPDEEEPAEELFPPQRPASQAIDRRASDLDALAFAIHLEQSAVEMYASSSRTTDDPAAQKAYGFLVDEETRHYHQFKAQWEKLAGCPFDEA
jgi:rubrerythrin